MKQNRTWSTLVPFHLQLLKEQDGIIRFNCFDSLDRTNTATFCRFFEDTLH